MVLSSASATFGAGQIYAFGVFLPVIVTAQGWSVTLVALAFSIVSAMNLVFSLISGVLSDRAEVRWLCAIGGLLSLVSFAFLGLSTELWEYYLGFGVLAGVGSSLLFVPPVAYVMKYLRDETSKTSAIGIVFSGTGLSLLVAPLIAGELVTGAGQAVAGLAIGAITLLSAIPPALLLRNSVSGTGEGAIKSVGTEEGAERASHTLRQALRTRELWLVYGTHISGVIASATILTLLVSIVAQKGEPLATATVALVLLGVASLLGRLVTSRILRQRGPRARLMLYFLVQAVVLSLLVVTRNIFEIYVLSSVFGLMYGGWIPQFPLVLRTRYGPEYAGALYGFVSTAFGVGGIIGPAIGGSLYDATGNYNLTLILASAACLISAALANSFSGKGVEDDPHRGGG